MLAKITTMLDLSELETIELSKFDEGVLQESWKVLQSSRSVSNKFRFLLGVCKNKQTSLDNKKVIGKSSFEGVFKKSYGKERSIVSENKEQFRDADLGIMPSIDLTTEENIERWEKYEEQAQPWAQQSDFHRKILKNRKQAYMQILDPNTPDSYLFKHTPDRLALWKKTAAQYREAVEIKEGEFNPIQSFMHNLLNKTMPDNIKNEPELNTSNETPQEQPKTQEEKKDSTNSNVVDISKYKDHPQVNEISSWLKSISKDPSYNPFDELEEINSPLLL